MLLFVQKNIIFVDEILRNMWLLQRHWIRFQTLPCNELAIIIIYSLDSCRWKRSGRDRGSTKVLDIGRCPSPSLQVNRHAWNDTIM